MSQNWTELLTSHTLANSRAYINQNFETLDTCWSGTSFPASPVNGRLFLNTSTWTWYIRGNGAWRTIGSANGDYIGLLPTSAGSSYPLTGDLYCGSKQIKSVSAPTAANDVVTKTWAETTLIDTNNTHDGTSGKGPKIPHANLNTTATAAWSFIQSNAANGGVGREWSWNLPAGTIALTGSYQNVASVSVEAQTNEPKLIICGACATSGVSTDTVYYRIQRSGTTISSEMQRSVVDDDDQFIYCTVNIPSAGTYTWALQAYEANSITLKDRFIVVI